MWFSRVTPLLYLLMLPVQPVMWIFWFPIYGIVCLLLCLAEGQTSSMFYRLDDTLAEVSPSSLMDGYVNETDGQFTIQCRILNNYYENSDLTPEKINSSSLYWSYNRRVLDHAYIVDQRTLGVTVQNITTLMSGKYHCKMNESAIGGKSDKSMVTTEITIGNPPEPVTSIKCVSLNWLEMICYWCPSKPVKHLSKYTLRYQIKRRKTEKSIYPNLTGCHSLKSAYAPGCICYYFDQDHYKIKTAIYNMQILHRGSQEEIVASKTIEVSHSKGCYTSRVSCLELYSWNVARGNAFIVEYTRECKCLTQLILKCSIL